MRVLAAIGAAIVRSSIMEDSTRQVSSRLPLEKVIAGAVSELERLGYSRRSLNRYRTVWRHLVAFCLDMSVRDEYCEDMVVKFYSRYRMQDGERLKAVGDAISRWLLKFWKTLRVIGISSAPSPTCRRYRSQCAW